MSDNMKGLDTFDVGFAAAEAKYTAQLSATQQKLEAAEAENAELTRKLGEKQAKIDRLMLEHCPDEMTAEQIETWAKHQIPVDAKTQALIDRAAAPQPETDIDRAQRRT